MAKTVEQLLKAGLLERIENRDVPMLKLRSPRGTAKWPKLNKPDTYAGSKPRFTTLLRIAEDEWEPYAQAIEAVWKDKKTFETVVPTKRRNKKRDGKKVKVPLAKLPWTEAVDKEKNSEGGYDETVVPGFVDVRFSLGAEYTNREGDVIARTIDLIDKSGKALDPKEVQIGGGSVLVIGAYVRPYYSNDEFGYGVSLQIGAVQVLEARASFSRDPKQEFGFEISDTDDDEDEIEAGEETPSDGSDDDGDEADFA